MLYLCTAVHLAGCVWFFNARLQSFSPNSWVVRAQLLDADVPTLYMTSVYWAFTVITTVGFGDHSARINSEISLAGLWMLIGVIFYSYAIGSLSTILSVVNSRESLLNTKLSAIKQFASETGISANCVRKITAAVKYRTQHSAPIFNERINIFNELPQNLKAKIAATMYDSVARTSIFLKGKDLSFITRVMPLLQPSQSVKGDQLYSSGEHADEMYLILKGSVAFVLQEYRIEYKSFVKGSMFGETELLLRTSRTDYAVSAENCQFLVLTKQSLATILIEFPTAEVQMKAQAIEKARRTARVKSGILAVINARVTGVRADSTDLLSTPTQASPPEVEETADEREARAADQVRAAKVSLNELCTRMTRLEEKVGSLFINLDFFRLSRLGKPAG